MYNIHTYTHVYMYIYMGIGPTNVYASNHDMSSIQLTNYSVHN